MKNLHDAITAAKGLSRAYGPLRALADVIADDKAIDENKRKATTIEALLSRVGATIDNNVNGRKGGLFRSSEHAAQVATNCLSKLATFRADCDALVHDDSDTYAHLDTRALRAKATTTVAKLHKACETIIAWNDEVKASRDVRKAS